MEMKQPSVFLRLGTNLKDYEEMVNSHVHNEWLICRLTCIEKIYIVFHTGIESQFLFM